MDEKFEKLVLEIDRKYIDKRYEFKDRLEYAFNVIRFIQNFYEDEGDETAIKVIKKKRGTICEVILNTECEDYPRLKEKVESIFDDTRKYFDNYKSFDDTQKLNAVKLKITGDSVIKTTLKEFILSKDIYKIIKCNNNSFNNYITTNISYNSSMSIEDIIEEYRDSDSKIIFCEVAALNPDGSEICKFWLTDKIIKFLSDNSEGEKFTRISIEYPHKNIDFNVKTDVSLYEENKHLFE